MSEQHTEQHHPVHRAPAWPVHMIEAKNVRLVNYVLSSGRHKGESRPAAVVKVWPEHSHDMVNLQVFTDASNDFLSSEAGYNGLLWATSVHYSATKEPGTWHWIEQA